MRLVRLIEAHADWRSHSLSRRLEKDPHCAELSSELNAGSYEIFSHLTDWLLYKTENKLAGAYTEIGLRRAEQGIVFRHTLCSITATKE